MFMLSQGVTSSSSKRECGSGISYFTNVLLFTEWISEMVDTDTIETSIEEVNSFAFNYSFVRDMGNTLPIGTCAL